MPRMALARMGQPLLHRHRHHQPPPLAPEPPPEAVSCQAAHLPLPQPPLHSPEQQEDVTPDGHGRELHLQPPEGDSRGVSGDDVLDKL